MLEPVVVTMPEIVPPTSGGRVPKSRTGPGWLHPASKKIPDNRVSRVVMKPGTRDRRASAAPAGWRVTDPKHFAQSPEVKGVLEMTRRDYSPTTRERFDTRTEPFDPMPIGIMRSHHHATVDLYEDIPPGIV